MHSADGQSRGCLARPVQRSILPVNVYRPSSTARNCIHVIRAVLPDHTAVGLNVDELELNVLARWSRNIQEPVWIIGIEHGTNCSGKCRAPVAQFNCAASQVDIVTGVS